MTQTYLVSMFLNILKNILRPRISVNYLSKYRDHSLNLLQYADPKWTGFSRENLSILGPHPVENAKFGETKYSYAKILLDLLLC